MARGEVTDPGHHPAHARSAAVPLTWRSTSRGAAGVPSMVPGRWCAQRT